MNDQPTTNQPLLTPREQADHDRSVHDYPDLPLSDTEYVVIDIDRSIFGLIKIWSLVVIIFIALAATILMIDYTSPIELDQPIMLGLLVGTVALPLIGGLITTYVYQQNYFIVTNERIFARIQYTPFAHRSQNVELEHVEDCSYSKNNIFQMAFNYGSIRLSTVGDEQTYTFNYVAEPKDQFSIVNRVVQSVDKGGTTRYHEQP